MEDHDLTILNEVLATPSAGAAVQSTPGVLMAAAMARRLCALRHFDGRVRVVEPYRIFQAKSGRRLLTCYQIAGYSRGTGTNGWKNLYLEDLYSAAPLAATYVDRTESKRRAAAGAALREIGLDPRDVLNAAA